MGSVVLLAVIRMAVILGLVVGNGPLPACRRASCDPSRSMMVMPLDDVLIRVDPARGLAQPDVLTSEWLPNTPTPTPSLRLPFMAASVSVATTSFPTRGRTTPAASWTGLAAWQTALPPVAPVRPAAFTVLGLESTDVVSKELWELLPLAPLQREPTATAIRTRIPLPTPGPTATPRPSPTPTLTPVPPTSTPTSVPAPTQILAPTSVPAPTEILAPTAIPPTPTPQVVSAAALAIDPAEYEVFAEVNRRRVELGLPELRPAASLFASARVHSLDQAANCFFSHTGSDGSDAGARMRAAGYNWANWGEALGRSNPGDAAGVVTALFNSPPHYEILFTTAFTEGGAGVAYSGDGIRYWSIDVANPRGG